MRDLIIILFPFMENLPELARPQCDDALTNIETNNRAHLPLALVSLGLGCFLSVLQPRISPDDQHQGMTTFRPIQVSSLASNHFGLI